MGTQSSAEEDEVKLMKMPLVSSTRPSTKGGVKALPFIIGTLIYVKPSMNSNLYVYDLHVCYMGNSFVYACINGVQRMRLWRGWRVKVCSQT